MPKTVRVVKVHFKVYYDISCGATFRNRAVVTNHMAVLVLSGNYSLAYSSSALRPHNLGG